MRTESIIFGIAGVFFGFLAGWAVVESQYATGARRAPEAAPAASQGGSTGQKPAPPLDERRVAELTAAAERNKADAETRVELANVYFDAERFNDAIKWYEDALQVDPRNPNASTDLGIAYYYTNQIDRALAQFDRSLAIDPKHTKTLLNRGFVLAFGKQDLDGAAKAWQQVVDIAPDSPEGQRARQSLEALRTAHPGGATPAQPSTPGKSSGTQD